jgi:hypothetical protein
MTLREWQWNAFLNFGHNVEACAQAVASGTFPAPPKPATPKVRKMSRREAEAIGMEGKVNLSSLTP